jgi:hypothetical protein
MPILYRLTDSQGELLSEADSIAYLQRLVEAFELGHYVVDEVTTGAEPSKQTTRRWGTIFKLVDGTILVEPEPE